jgi:hypothetical protein
MAIVFVLGGLGGYFAGNRAGFRESTLFWSRLSEEQTVNSTLGPIVTLYPPLKLLKEGQTEKATHQMQAELKNALDGVDIISQALHRSDMLTNSLVLRAKNL